MIGFICILQPSPGCIEGLVQVDVGQVSRKNGLINPISLSENRPGGLICIKNHLLLEPLPQMTKRDVDSGLYRIVLVTQ